MFAEDVQPFDVAILLILTLEHLPSGTTNREAVWQVGQVLERYRALVLVRGR